MKAGNEITISSDRLWPLLCFCSCGLLLFCFWERPLHNAALHPTLQRSAEASLRFGKPPTRRRALWRTHLRVTVLVRVTIDFFASFSRSEHTSTHDARRIITTFKSTFFSIRFFFCCWRLRVRSCSRRCDNNALMRKSCAHSFDATRKQAVWPARHKLLEHVLPLVHTPLQKSPLPVQRGV